MPTSSFTVDPDSPEFFQAPANFTEALTQFLAQPDDETAASLELPLRYFVAVSILRLVPYNAETPLSLQADIEAYLWRRLHAAPRIPTQYPRWAEREIQAYLRHIYLGSPLPGLKQQDHLPTCSM